LNIYLSLAFRRLARSKFFPALLAYGLRSGITFVVNTLGAFLEHTMPFLSDPTKPNTLIIGFVVVAIKD
jgi:hypothetical protein